jgi:signal transduction histidine kinase
MQTLTTAPTLFNPEQRLVAEHLGHAADSIHASTDQLFARLMIFQWLGGIVAALWLTPKTWIGSTSQLHLHLWAAIILGGALAILPAFLAWRMPGQTATRHVIAIAQCLTSALLIHLTGGRIETHFHVFGSLAFIAFYRDWRVLTTATLIVAIDHIARGIFWPQSVFGIMTSTPWRWLEHAAWVAFEDTFLFVSIHRSLQEMTDVAQRRASLEAANQELEARTLELQEEMRERIEAQNKLKQTHDQLLRASRQAGMAEVATSVLHNVGNALNGVNVSATLVVETLSRTRLKDLPAAAELLNSHKHDLATFFTESPQGNLFPGFIDHLAIQWKNEHAVLQREAATLTSHIHHVREIIQRQQAISRVAEVIESVKVATIIEDTISLAGQVLVQNGVQLHRDLLPDLIVLVDRSKLIQILVNLIANAAQALAETDQPRREVKLRSRTPSPGRATIEVIDNGPGIQPEHLTQIFAYGFTTKKEGHGFGLHSSALAAKTMGGSLQAHSDGPGQGATFTLELTAAPQHHKSHSHE